MSVRIIIGDAREKLKELADESVHCVVTSPPYWGLRDYGCAGQIGLESTPDAFITELADLFDEVRRVLRADGTLWLNLGDSYAGSGRGGNPTEETSGLQGGQASQRASMVKRTRPANEIGSSARDAAVTNLGRRATRGSQLPAGFHEQAVAEGAIGRAWVPPPTGLKQKDLIGTPWLVAFALRARGWYLRQDIIWAKPNPMPESVSDRCTKSHEYLFLLSKSDCYYYDADAIKEASISDHPSGNGYKRDARLTYKTPDGTPRGNDAQWAAVGGTRNKRSVWSISTQAFPEAHFATFPPDLVEPCCKAGTSERGCCPKCGTGWQRITAAVETGKTHKMPDGMATYAGGHTAIHKDGREKGAADNPVTANVTIGWYPDCACAGLRALPPYPPKPSRALIDDEAAYKLAMKEWRGGCGLVDDARRKLCDAAAPLPLVRGTVLDPFGGAGTTGLVADRLQRNAILIELNPEYAAMAERRIRGEAGLMADVTVEQQQLDAAE